MVHGSRRCIANVCKVDCELLQMILVYERFEDVQVPTYLLRQMISAEGEASDAFGAEFCVSTCELLFFLAISTSIRGDRGQR
jgi:hypothetical protein